MSWRLQVTAAPEPLLLARLLQRLAAPEIALAAADYDSGAASGEARATLAFAACAARARLATARVAKLMSVRTAVLSPQPGGGPESPTPLS